MPASLLPAEVLSKEFLTDEVACLRVSYPSAALPGQFFMLKSWEGSPLLPRPISVFDYQNGVLSFLILKRGTGTDKLCSLESGDSLTLSGPFGNGFNTNLAQRKRVALIGGGIGIAPLLFLAKNLPEKPVLIAGFRDRSYAMEEFAPHVSNIRIATDNGTEGHHGFVTDLFTPEEFDLVYCCGPEMMMERIARASIEKNTTCYVSKEAKMACGVGACLGCTCKTAKGPKSICKDGPVFLGEELYA